MNQKNWLCGLLCVLSVVAVGCGPSGPQLYQVKGRVTHNGKPVKYIYLTFIPDDETTKAISTSSSDENGNFEMKIGSTPGVYPGEVTIAAHDPLIAIGSKTSTEPDYLEVCKKYAPGKSALKMKIEKNETNLELKLD